MPDLIDRKQIAAYIADQSYLWEDDYDIDQVLGDIEDAPAVAAIPVEFIESTMNRWKEIIGYEESVDALRILIDNWKNERKEE